MNYNPDIDYSTNIVYYVEHTDIDNVFDDYIINHLDYFIDID